MVEGGDADADEVPREGVRVVEADLGADHRRLVVDLEDVLGRGREAHPVTDLGVVALAHPLDGEAEVAGLLLDRVEVFGVLDLEAELDDADAALFDDDGVVVPLVPALVVDLARLAQGLVEADGVRVVVLRLVEVGYPRVHVAHAHYGHCVTPSSSCRMPVRPSCPPPG